MAGLALAGLQLDPLRAVAVHHDAYVNKKLGILFHKPLGWHFLQVKDFGRLKDAQMLHNEWDWEREEIWKDLEGCGRLKRKNVKKQDSRPGI